MALMILIFGYLLDAAYGSAFPQITPPARLQIRQNNGLLTLWSPTVIGTTLTYESFTPPNPSDYIITSGNYWALCLGDINTCPLNTQCVAGTLYDQTSSVICDNTVPICGTEYLYSTTGAVDDLTRLACYPTTGPTIESFFLVSPAPTAANSVTHTSSPTTSTSSSSLPTPVSKSSSNAGAIAGGVVGGVVGIAIIVAIVLLILRNREKQSTSADPAVGQAEVVQQQPPPDSPYDPKQAAHFSSYPSSPTPAPPQYQSPPTQSNVFYTQHPQQSPNPADSYGGYVPPSSVPPTSPVPAYGNIPSQPELPYNIASPHGIAEMNADQGQR